METRYNITPSLALQILTFCCSFPGSASEKRRRLGADGDFYTGDYPGPAHWPRLRCIAQWIQLFHKRLSFKKKP